MKTIVIVGVIAVVLLVLAVVFRSWVRALIERLGEGLGWLWFVVMWFFPPILYGVGYVMRDIVQFLARVIPGFESSAGMELLLLLCFGVVGAGVQWITSANPNTSLRSLIADHLVSSGWAAITIWVAAVAYATGDFKYWIVFPAIYATIELMLTGVTGLRNAFQKNPTQLQRQ